MRRLAGDIAVVFWQEWVERLATVDGRRSLLTSIVASVAFFGVVIPLAAGAWWAHEPAVILVWAWMPMFFVVDIAADTFAGERERNTLETLLVSRLSNRAILTGKLLAVFAYAWLLLLICLATGMLAVTVVMGVPPLLRSPGGFVLVLAMTFLVALFTAAAGVAISMRTRSSRQAQQFISLVLFAAFLVVTAAAARLTASASDQQMSLPAAGLLSFLLAIVDLGLILWLAVSFRRSRLLAG